MFLEPYQHHTKTGCIEVICGSMFSGKTEELLRRIKRARIANLNVIVFKPLIDNRYSQEKIVSHDENWIPSIEIERSIEIVSHVSNNTNIIGVDEAQFFDNSLPPIVHYLAKKGIRVIIGGLDMNYLGEPFGPMPILLAQADYVTKLHAICMQCGSIAQYTYRKKNMGKEQIVLGAKDKYEARCRNCYVDGMKEQGYEN